MPLQVIKLKQENEQLRQEFDDLVEQSKVGVASSAGTACQTAQQRAMLTTAAEQHF